MAGFGRKVFFISLLIIISYIFIPTVGAQNKDSVKSGENQTTILNEKIKTLMEEAVFFKTQKNYADAMDNYKTILGLNSEYIPAHEGLIDCSINTKNIKATSDYYKKKIEEKPDSPGWYFGLGLFYLKNGKINEASVSFNKMTEPKCIGDPKHPLYLKSKEYSKQYGFKVNPPLDKEAILKERLKIGIIILFALIAFFSIRYVVNERALRFEGTFEVYSPLGLKTFILYCNDRNFARKYGDVIKIGSHKDCAISLKVEKEEKVYAILEVEKVGKKNRIVIKPIEKDVLFLDVPKSRYTPDDLIKLPFEGGLLWDKDIVNIKDYQIHYFNVKTGKRAKKDYPSAARGYLFIDGTQETPKQEDIGAPVLSYKAESADDIYYETYKRDEPVKTQPPPKIKPLQMEYEIEPMDSKYYMETPLPPVKPAASDVLKYTLDVEEEHYKFEPVELLKPREKSEDILLYPVFNEDEEYKYEKLPPVSKVSENSDVLLYPSDTEDSIYEFTLLPEKKESAGDTLSFPVPTEEDNEMMLYASKSKEAQPNVPKQLEIKIEETVSDEEYKRKEEAILMMYMGAKVQDFDIGTKTIDKLAETPVVKDDSVSEEPFSVLDFDLSSPDKPADKVSANDILIPESPLFIMEDTSDGLDGFELNINDEGEPLEEEETPVMEFASLSEAGHLDLDNILGDEYKTEHSSNTNSIHLAPYKENPMDKKEKMTKQLESSIVKDAEEQIRRISLISAQKKDKKLKSTKVLEPSQQIEFEKSLKSGEFDLDKLLDDEYKSDVPPEEEFKIIRNEFDLDSILDDEYKCDYFEEETEEQEDAEELEDEFDLDKLLDDEYKCDFDELTDTGEIENVSDIIQEPKTTQILGPVLQKQVERKPTQLMALNPQATNEEIETEKQKAEDETGSENKDVSKTVSKKGKKIKSKINSLIRELKAEPKKKETRKELIKVYGAILNIPSFITQCQKLLRIDKNEMSWVKGIYEELVKREPHNDEVINAFKEIKSKKSSGKKDEKVAKEKDKTIETSEVAKDMEVKDKTTDTSEIKKDTEVKDKTTDTSEVSKDTGEKKNPLVGKKIIKNLKVFKK